MPVASEKQKLFLFLGSWQRNIIKLFWTNKSSGKKKGRKITSKDIRNIILSIKNDNILWGVKKKIQGELIKLDIHLDTKTIWNILRTFRRKGIVKKYMNWKKFLSMHINSIFGMDFFTIDTIFNKRYYVFFVISHQTREIIRCAITQSPTREFVRQQTIEFEKQVNRVVLNEYISYYNNKRLHQGIDQRVPQKYNSYKNGKITKLPILSGFHHHYYRKVA